MNVPRSHLTSTPSPRDSVRRFLPLTVSDTARIRFKSIIASADKIHSRAEAVSLLTELVFSVCKEMSASQQEMRQALQIALEKEKLF